jgi:uncharacterized protein YkwD
LRRLPVSLLTGFLVLAALVIPAVPAAADVQRDAIYQINQIRADHGVAPLRPSPSLHRSATRYARQMVRRRYFGHAARIAMSSGFGQRGETLAMHSGWTPLPDAAVSGWMGSEHHRELLLSSEFRWVGLGIARGDVGSGPVTLWVAHLGG